MRRRYAFYIGIGVLFVGAMVVLVATGRKGPQELSMSGSESPSPVKFHESHFETDVTKFFENEQSTVAVTTHKKTGMRFSQLCWCDD